MEEVSRQLGENLPVALAMGAESMGKTQAEFIALIEAGQVRPKEFMLNFARTMRSGIRKNGAYQASLTKLQASIGRLSNEWKIMINDIFQGSAGNSIGKRIEQMAKAIRIMAPRIRELITLFTDIAVVVSDLTGSLFGMGQGMEETNKQAGLFLRIWWLIQGIIYSVLAGMELVTAQLDKISGNKLLMLGPGGVALNMASNYLSDGKGWFDSASKNQAPSNNKTTTVSIGQVNVKTTSDNAEVLAMDFMQQMSHQLGAF